MDDYNPETATELITVPLGDETDELAEAPTMPIPLFELPAENRGKVRQQDGRETKKEDGAPAR